MPEFGGIPKHQCPSCLRSNLFEQLKPFRAHLEIDVRQARGVTIRPRQTRKRTVTDGIGNLHEHDWKGAGRLQQGWHGGAGRDARGRLAARPSRAAKRPRHPEE
jgi:hypothetical protein